MGMMHFVFVSFVPLSALNDPRDSLCRIGKVDACIKIAGSRQKAQGLANQFFRAANSVVT